MSNTLNCDICKKSVKALDECDNDGCTKLICSNCMEYCNECDGYYCSKCGECKQCESDKTEEDEPVKKTTKKRSAPKKAAPAKKQKVAAKKAPEAKKVKSKWIKPDAYCTEYATKMGCSEEDYCQSCQDLFEENKLDKGGNSRLTVGFYPKQGGGVVMWYKKKNSKTGIAFSHQAHINSSIFIDRQYEDPKYGAGEEECFEIHKGIFALYINYIMDMHGITLAGGESRKNFVERVKASKQFNIGKKGIKIINYDIAHVSKQLVKLANQGY